MSVSIVTHSRLVGHEPPRVSLQRPPCARRPPRCHHRHADAPGLPPRGRRLDRGRSHAPAEFGAPPGAHRLGGRVRSARPPRPRRRDEGDADGLGAARRERARERPRRPGGRRHDRHPHAVHPLAAVGAGLPAPARHRRRAQPVVRHAADREHRRGVAARRGSVHRGPPGAGRGTRAGRRHHRDREELLAPGCAKPPRPDARGDGGVPPAHRTPPPPRGSARAPPPVLILTALPPRRYTNHALRAASSSPPCAAAAPRPRRPDPSRVDRDAVR